MQHAGARKLREDEYAQDGPSRPELKLVEGQRRTVVITGQPMPPRRRAPVATQQIQARPDRIALWAFLLGLLLIVVATLSAQGL